MKNQDQYLKSLSKSKFNRVISWLCIVIVVGLIVATFVTGIMGSKYFMGFLVLMILVPIIFYIVLWIGRLLFNYGNSPIEFVEQKSGEDTDAVEDNEASSNQQ
ncbi:MAG: hypothetical protein PUB54_09680 [Lachnospiraceae bacterium]|nr:hypothetical protein [Lachnospiraceae bacterium]